MEIVNDIAAAHNQDAFFAQRGEFLADLEVEKGRLGFVNAELHDGNVGNRIHMAKHRPCAMIKAPRFVQLNRQGREQLLNSVSQEPELSGDRQSIRMDSKHRNLAVPHHVIGNAAQKQMLQSGVTVSSHYDHLAIQFQRGIHNRGTW